MAIGMPCCRYELRCDVVVVFAYVLGIFGWPQQHYAALPEENSVAVLLLRQTLDDFVISVAETTAYQETPKR